MNSILQKGNVLFVVFAFALAFLFSKSPLLVGFDARFHIDSQVYLYTSLSILEGKILYKEVFDHKGPLLYVIDIIGLFISNKHTWGIWLIQYLLILLSFRPLLIKFYEKYGALSTCTASILFITWLYRFMTIGDHIPELYAIPFISYGLYLSLDIFDDKKLSEWNVFLLGMMLSCILLIKFNIVILMFPLVCWLLFIQFKHKKLMISLLILLLGTLVTLLPFLIYFYYFNALSEAIYAIWTFNISYIQANEFTALQSVKEVLFSSKQYFLWMILLLPLLKLLFSVKNSQSIWVLLFTFSCALIFLVALPGRGNESRHYLLPLAPFVSYLVFGLLKDLKMVFEYAAIIVVMYFAYPMIYDIYHQKNIKRKNNEIVQYLNKYSKEDQSLLVIGNQPSVYWESNLESPVKYFYTFPILQQCKNDSSQSFLQSFQKNQATWIYIENKYAHSDCLKELLKPYHQVIENIDIRLYQLP